MDGATSQEVSTEEPSYLDKQMPDGIYFIQLNSQNNNLNQRLNISH
jgi:hypothetical protein